MTSMWMSRIATGLAGFRYACYSWKHGSLLSCLMVHKVLNPCTFVFAILRINRNTSGHLKLETCLKTIPVAIYRYHCVRTAWVQMIHYTRTKVRSRQMSTIKKKIGLNSEWTCYHILQVILWKLLLPYKCPDRELSVTLKPKFRLHMIGTAQKKNSECQ